MDSNKRTVLACPSCGARMTGQEQTCPSCGESFAAEAMLECPFCGEKVPREAESCPTCRMSFRKSVQKPVEDNLDRLLNQLISPETRQSNAKGNKVPCPKCACLLTGTEKECPICACDLTKLSGVRCPICDSKVAPGTKRCLECGWVFDSADKPPSHPKSEPKITTPKPSQPKTPVPAQQIKPMPAKTVPAPPIEAPPKQTRMARCPRCGHDSPIDSASCPYCGVEFETMQGAEPELTQAARDVDEASRSLAALEKEVEQRRTKKRKLRNGSPTARSAAVPQSEISAGRLGKGKENGFVNGRHLGRPGLGVTNGTGLVNGSGVTNGVGAVNGLSMVNGSGASNRQGVKGRSKRLSPKDLPMRWRVLAVLVAVIFVISAFLMLGSIRSSEKFSIDGSFKDWTSVQSYPALVSSASSGINVQEWSAVFSESDFYFYIRTESATMAGASAESFCMFIDTDSSSSTGYAAGDVGADYRLLVEGWNGTVHSSSLSSYGLQGDQMDWNSWAAGAPAEVILKGNEIEGHAQLGAIGSPSPRVVLVSNDELGNTCYSAAVPVGSSLLLVDQKPATAVRESGIVGSGTSMEFLEVTLSAIGGAGTVTNIAPETQGCSLATAFVSTQIQSGASTTFDFSVDTTSSTISQLVSASIPDEAVDSDFDQVLILGTGAKAYLGQAPENVTIDGAFADWAERTSTDSDSLPVDNGNIDILETGASNSSQEAFFFVSVKGEMCAGAYLPRMCSHIISGGGGTYVQTRKTAEDVTRIYIDADNSSGTGLSLSYSGKSIGAEKLLEIKGLYGRITSEALLEFSSGSWVSSGSAVHAENDDRALEVSVSLADLDCDGPMDFFYETTGWDSKSDRASCDPLGQGLGTRTWLVGTSVAPPTATAMSYQRKLFHDGANFWSFYFDGSNTVHQYSADDGVTWTSLGSVFKTSGVNETSVWYDSSANIVYAVGDTSSASRNVYLQRGTVDSGAHTISWAGSDSTLATSSLSLAGKNAFICKDANGYLWVMSSNNSQSKKYDLTMFRSASADSIGSWLFSGQMLGASSSSDTVKGSVVPAGSGSNVWAIYADSGGVSSRKYTGTWQSPQTSIYGGGGSNGNTENSPPSVVVDAKGVVHVIYGTGRKTTPGGVSIPEIEYAHNNTGATTFTAGVSLDSSIPANVGDYYPTVSLDTSTGDIYAYWLRSDSSLVPMTLMGKKCSSGTWSNLSFDPQTSYPKRYLTSVYSISGESRMSVQWTQNTTSAIEVVFDNKIPEFGDAVVPAGLLVASVLVLARRRVRKGTRESS